MMTTQPPSIDRRIRIPITVAVVLVGVIVNVLTDMVAEGEFSQWTGYRNWEPFGIFAVYYPTLMDIIRWLVPLLGVGTLVMACRQELRTEHFVWSLSGFAVVTTVSIAIGIFMVYGLYSVTHHRLGR
jgi:hypothetical protein